MACRLGSADGAEIAEAALVLPLVFLFLLGIVWFGRAFNIYSTITQAAQQGAVTAARPVCATCPQPACQWNNTNFPCDATVETAVLNVMAASSLDKGLIMSNSVSPPFCTAQLMPAGACSTTTNNITVCRSVLLNPPAGGGAPQQCGTIVTFQYPFQFYLPFTSLNMQKVILTAQAQTRMEN